MTTLIGTWNYCPRCGAGELSTLMSRWPHRTCLACSRVYADTRSIVAVAIPIHRGSVYLGNRDKGGLIAFPGGFVEEHSGHNKTAESTVEAAFREFVEETGYVGSLDDIVVEPFGEALATEYHTRLFFHVFHLPIHQEPRFCPLMVETPGEFAGGAWYNVCWYPSAHLWAFETHYQKVSKLAQQIGLL